jgi:hypothetical protein
VDIHPMILIVTFDSDRDNDTPRQHRPMPAGPQYWFLKLWALGNNGEIHASDSRVKSPVGYHDFRKQYIEDVIDEMRDACGGIIRFKFWLYKAR